MHLLCSKVIFYSLNNYYKILEFICFYKLPLIIYKQVFAVMKGGKRGVYSTVWLFYCWWQKAKDQYTGLKSKKNCCQLLNSQLFHKRAFLELQHHPQHYTRIICQIMIVIIVLYFMNIYITDFNKIIFTMARRFMYLFTTGMTNKSNSKQYIISLGEN